MHVEIDKERRIIAFDHPIPPGDEKRRPPRPKPLAGGEVIELPEEMRDAVMQAGRKFLSKNGKAIRVEEVPHPMAAHLAPRGDYLRAVAIVREAAKGDKVWAAVMTLMGIPERE